jgi:signal transduction histidine kinase
MLIYETRQELFAAAVPLMEVGLRRGEKCIYLCEETRPAEVLEAMREYGMDPEGAIRSGALTVIAARTIPGSGRRGAAFDLLAESGGGVDGAAVRLVREVGFGPAETVSQAEIEEDERRLAACFQGMQYVDVPMYNQRRVPPHVLLNAIRSRPVVIWDGTVCENLHAAIADERLAPDPTVHEVARVLINLRDRQRIEDRLSEQSRNAPIVGAGQLHSVLATGAASSGCGTCLTQISTLHEQILQTEKMEALGRMAAGMVNEFRNALTGILGFTELLIDGMEPDDKGLHLAKKIFQAGQNASELTNQLLAFGRPGMIRPEVLDLNAAVSDLAGVLRCSLMGRMELRIVTAPAECPVKVDRRQLGQVLLNLVLNGRDAMPQGGTITIRTGRTFRGADSRFGQGSRSEAMATLSVTDTGNGMDAETRKRVFEPFFTTKGPGLRAGMGMPVVLGIVQQQFGGSISVDSTPGRGTTVTIYLPTAEKPAD